MNPNNFEFGIVPTEDVDAKLMFGVVVSKETPYFVKLCVKKIYCFEN